MKRVVVCAAILFAMAVLGAFLQVDAENAVTEFIAKVQVLEASAVAGETAALSENAKKLSREWESFCENNIYLTNNEGAFEVTQSLIRIAAAADEPEDAARECRTARLLLEDYRRSRALSLGNIF